MKQVKWIVGNKLRLVIPLESETVTPDGRVTTPYEPPVGSSVKVVLVSRYGRCCEYKPEMDGNRAIITDNGELPAGDYDVEINVTEPGGTRRRSRWPQILQICPTNEAVLQEWNEFAQPATEVLTSAIFFFAKGDKGDSFNYKIIDNIIDL